MKNSNISKTLALLLISSTIFAWTYDDVVDSSMENEEDTHYQKPLKVRSFLYDNKASDTFFNEGVFDKIIRFDMIVFVDNEVDDNSKQILYDAIQTIKGYENSSDNIRVTIIGHTSAITEDENEKCVESGTYAKAICNLFTSCLTKADARKKSKEYAAYIEKIMNRNGVAPSITVVDYQSGKDLAFSDSTNKGRDLSNRVMITLYIKSKRYKKSYQEDRRRTSVVESYDFEDQYDNSYDVYEDERFEKVESQHFKREEKPQKFNTYKATEYKYKDNEIALKDSDNDGVSDTQDRCEKTPTGVIVNAKGCPYDSDKDGVFDYKDKCPNTQRNADVDKFGCVVSVQKVLKRILPVHFEHKTKKIQYRSYPMIKKFARFLKDNEVYNMDIIGHTDSVGSAKDNFLLSEERAKAIKEAFSIEGVSADRLKAYGRGESEPLKSNRTQTGRDANNRIEIKLYR